MKDELFIRTGGFISKIYELEAKLDRQMGDREVTTLQLNLLKILYFDSSRNLSSLSKCLNINLPNCSREVKKLTTQGFVSKVTSTEDKRQTTISLTEKGRIKVETLLQHMKNTFFAHNEDWTDEKIQRCLDSIDQLERELLVYDE